MLLSERTQSSRRLAPDAPHARPDEDWTAPTEERVDIGEGAPNQTYEAEDCETGLPVAPGVGIGLRLGLGFGLGFVTFNSDHALRRTNEKGRSTTEHPRTPSHNRSCGVSYRPRRFHAAAGGTYQHDEHDSFDAPGQRNGSDLTELDLFHGFEDRRHPKHLRGNRL